MTADPRLPEGLTPRLLARDAAAAYLGISAVHFTTHVVPAVPPIAIGSKLLWDRQALDRWLDRRSGIAHDAPSRDQLLKALDADQHAGHQAR